MCGLPRGKLRTLRWEVTVDYLGWFGVILGLPEEGGGVSERERAEGRAEAWATKREDTPVLAVRMEEGLQVKGCGYL